MPCHDSNTRLLELARRVVYARMGEIIRQTKYRITAEDARRLPLIVNLIDCGLNCLDREDLVKIADLARREKIAKPRKRKAISDEQGEVFLAVRRRMKAGFGEHRACDDEARARGFTLNKELAAFWVEYRRIKVRITQIVAPLGFNANQI